MFWSIGGASNVQLYEAELEKLKNFDAAAFDWVKRAPSPKSWCKAFFPPHTKYNMLTNNLCETFNSHILGARELSIIGMLEAIRKMLMDRIEKRVEWMRKYDGPVGPTIKELIQENIKLSSSWKTIANRDNGFQLRALGRA
ncbi:hypothetical protein ACH5RR_009389 [Cinchona calisaya]|uniref:Transposase n=1 Tax=Cinchona calisaya TaxID=153742 RepID=A0ABD3AEB3_9GENT